MSDMVSSSIYIFSIYSDLVYLHSAILFDLTESMTMNYDNIPAAL